MTRLRQLFGDLVAEISAVSVADFWSWQALAAVAALGMAAFFARNSRLRREAAKARDASSGQGLVASLIARLAPPGLLFAVSLVGVVACRVAGVADTLLLAVTVLTALMLVTRLVLFALLRSLTVKSQISLVERVGAWVLWLLLVLGLFQWFAPALHAVDAIAIPVAGSRVSLLDAIRVMVVLLLVVVAATYLGAFVERRVLALASLPIGVRVGVAKVSRVLLMVMAILLGLNAVGMDLTALTVIGGAVGVGLGFGLQRIASNFVSGFVLLGDRSIRPGDVITIGTRFGVVRELRARYVVVRDRDGVDTLIPNENIITSEVINWSYADRRIRLKLPVMISYQDNPRQAMKLMEDAATAHPRVVNDPAPASRVMGFADSGIELELRFWIRDPEDGVNNVRSDLFLAVWDAFQAAGITIPYPQREIHLQGNVPRMVPPQEQE